MDTVSLTNLAIATYLVAFAYRSITLGIDPETGKPPSSRWPCLPLTLVAVGLHALALLKADDFGANINFSLFHAMSLVMLVTNIVVLLTSLSRPVEQLGIVTFPLTALIMIVGQLFPEPVRIVHQVSTGMTTHILSSILAFSFLSIAALQAILLSVQDVCLRRRHFKAWILRSMPSLETMESLMFRLIGGGLILLSISLATGFLFLENMFAQHLAHKTILSLLAWVVFGILLFGRARFGWRGIVAIRWTLFGFFSLLLAYFGSKVAIELILRRG
jgi:ABC-type uncharacterized transport system permease subunit